MHVKFNLIFFLMPYELTIIKKRLSVFYIIKNVESRRNHYIEVILMDDLSITYLNNKKDENNDSDAYYDVALF